jgi:hypothetical protein
VKNLVTQFFATLDDAEIWVMNVISNTAGASIAPHIEIWPTGAAYIVTVRF